jgi:hypothetical protein
MNTKISKVISETVFDSSVREHRNQLTVFFDDGESVKYDFYNTYYLQDALRNIDYINRFRGEFVFDCKEKVSFLHLFYTAYIQAYLRFVKNKLPNIRERLSYGCIDTSKKIDAFPSEMRGHIGFGFGYSAIGYKDGHRYSEYGTVGCLDYLYNKVEDIEEEIIYNFERTFNKLLDEVEKGTENHDNI